MRLRTLPAVRRRDVTLRPAAVAMVWVGPGQRHETVAVPGVALGEGDALVAVELSTVCEADVHTLLGGRPSPAPAVLGHEGVGRLIALGDAGARAAEGGELRIGDRVVWSTTAPCGSCDRCTAGVRMRCRTPLSYGQERIGAHGELTGTFASHVQLRAGTTIVRVPETLPAAVLAPAACVTATAWAAVARAARERCLEGARVRVHGAGPLGLSVAAIAAAQGAEVHVVDPDPRRHGWGPRFGADGFDGPADVVVDTSGHAVVEALETVAPAGVVVLVGRALPAVPTTLDVEGFIRGRMTLAGVDGAAGPDLVEAVAFLAGRGRAYPFAELVGDIRALSEIDGALAAAAEPGAPLRIGLSPGR